MNFTGKTRIAFRLLFIIISLLFYNNLFSQAPSIEWQKCLGGSLVETTRSFKQTANNGYILAGHSKSSNGDLTENKGLGDAWIVKLDSQANILWQKTYGGSSHDEPMCAIETTDGGYIFCGITYSTDGDVIGGTGIKEGWIVKLSSNGTIQWQKIIANSEVRSIIESNDGGYVVTGQTNSLFEDIYITKIDLTGNTVWSHTYGGSQNDYSGCIINANDGGYIFSGTTNSTNGNISFNHGQRDAWVIKVDHLGIIQWEKTYGGSEDDTSTNIEKTSDNGYILCAQSSSNDGDVTVHYGTSATKDAWLVKLDSNGVIEWQKTLGGSNHEFNCNVKQIPNDNGYIALYHTYSNNGDITNFNGFCDFWVIRLNALGQLEWQRTLGGNANDFPVSILQTNDNGYLVAGDTGSTSGQISGNHGQSDSWIVKLAPDSLNNTNFEYPKVSFSPNPSTNYIQINSNTGILNKTIYDNLGRVIYFSETPEDQIDISFLSKGIFFMEIEDINKKLHKQKLIKL